MSRKQAARARPAGRRRAPSPAAGGGGLARQLRALGLKLREVPGDGNCLFRALGDQLEGHSRNHLRHRQETVDYMIKQREEFEPFVEDDVPFEKHVTNLAKPGTFAGNDAIVAFARNNQMNVVIHQLNAPLWQIRGTDKNNARELHIAYRYGEHYDSVRRIDDDSEAPAYLQMEPEKSGSEDEIEVEKEAAIQKVCSATGCSVKKTLLLVGAEEQRDPQSKGQKSCTSALWEDNRNGSRIFRNQSLHQDEIENHKGLAKSNEDSRSSKNPKVSKKLKKEQQRLEKKKRQEERHRQKVLANKSNCADSNRREMDSDNQITLVKAMTALNI
uniref:OTU domain-containing protein 3 n=1 Tax=Anser cygnoides TaxID=8845 RepID=A0A8B9DX65_ANSCY